MQNHIQKKLRSKKEAQFSPQSCVELIVCWILLVLFYKLMCKFSWPFYQEHLWVCPWMCPCVCPCVCLCGCDIVLQVIMHVHICTCHINFVSLIVQERWVVCVKPEGLFIQWQMSLGLLCECAYVRVCVCEKERERTRPCADSWFGLSQGI